MEGIKLKLSEIDGVIFTEGESSLDITADWRSIPSVARGLRHDWGRPVDFLIDIVGVDLGESLGVIYYLNSSERPEVLISLRTSTPDREEPKLHSLYEFWDSALLYEREVYDFFGIRFINHPDMRRLFLRSDWNGFPLRKDYDASPEKNPIPKDNEEISEMERIPTINMMMGDERVTEQSHQLFGEHEYVVNFGPQHPATHGVLQLRASLAGENIKRVDPIFGYIHRGIEKMSEKYTYPQILHLTDRLDYLSGTINRHAMCLCCEGALELEVPMRAQYIRTIFDELTRIASHLLGWGSMCMDMGSITAFIYGMRDREKIMDIFEETAGGRLMVNYATIGGVMKDLHPNFQKRVKEFIPYMRKMLKEYHILFTGNPIARGRMRGIGHLSREQAISFGVTGPAGRASGWHNDIRKIAPYAAYDKVSFTEVVREGGYTFDRYIIRLDEIEQSLRIIEQLIENIPEGDFVAKTRAVIRLPEGEYYQRVENARGEFGIYISSKGEKSPERIKFRSPSLALVSSLDTIVRGGKIADLIMIGASLDYIIPCMDR